MRYLLCLLVLPLLALSLAGCNVSGSPDTEVTVNKANQPELSLTLDEPGDYSLMLRSAGGTATPLASLEDSDRASDVGNVRLLDMSGSWESETGVDSELTSDLSSVMDLAAQIRAALTGQGAASSDGGEAPEVGGGEAGGNSQGGG